MTLFSVFLHIWCALTKPQWAKCPKGWFVNGVTPAGVFRCHQVWGDLEYTGRIYCTAPREPRLVKQMAACVDAR